MLIEVCISASSGVRGARVRRVAVRRSLEYCKSRLGPSVSVLSCLSYSFPYETRRRLVTRRSARSPLARRAGRSPCARCDGMHLAQCDAGCAPPGRRTRNRGVASRRMGTTRGHVLLWVGGARGLDAGRKLRLPKSYLPQCSMHKSRPVPPPVSHALRSLNPWSHATTQSQSRSSEAFSRQYLCSSQIAWHKADRDVLAAT